MRSRAVRLTLTLLAVAALAAAAYLVVTIERSTNTAMTSAREIDARITAASRQVLELRAAQQAYVASGQSIQFWFPKAAATMTGARESLTALRVSVATAASQLPLDEALQTLQEFERMDGRAREHVVAGQLLLASDLIFSDGLETTAQMLTALEQARLSEAEALLVSHVAARREQLVYAAAAGGLLLLTLLFLLPLPRAEEPVSVVPERLVAPADLDLVPRGDDLQPMAITPGPAPPPAPAIDLDSVAGVCAELARVADTASLPSLLERTATALDALGVVLWIADPDGRELTPIVSHGYPASLLSRMGSIAKDADNVTASAFRTGLLQIVNADATSNGAIAAPLVNASGCIGVMSAEVRHGAEKQPERLAVATIVAAQLATLVAPAAREPRTAAI
jgi:hypothetical protein